MQGRHKKQTGGHGQYGDCKIKMEPLPRGGEFEFVNDIFGGAIPKNYIPAVEKGIVDAAARGYLAGFPVVDFRVILYDGSYHDVDSNDLSFQMAGRIAFKKAMEQAKPTLLEPIMSVEITIPDEFAGSIMGDLNSRRGRIQGMDNKGGNTVVKAEVPMAEMLTYGIGSHLDDAGPRQLQHGNASLRRRARIAAGKDYREGESRARRCEGRGRVGVSKCFLLRLWKKGSEMRGEDVTTTTNWRWVTDDANFARLKADKVFWFVIALARVVNALRFVQMPLLDSEGKDSPSAVRARLNSFFFGCSLFYEASLFVQGLPGPYRTMAEFQSMAAIINGKDARNLRDSNLDNLRNKLVFHFDVEEIGKRVQTLQHPVFLTATGKANSEVYYEIADACTFVAFKEVEKVT